MSVMRQIAWAICVWIGTALPAYAGQLPPAVAHALEQVGIPVRDVSIYVRDANTKEIVVDQLIDAPRSPASTIKVLTTFAALDTLGPAYTWKTRAFAAGPVSNGVLHGDLYLVGGGDPYMTSERWWSFVQALRETGLAKIDGDVVIDNSFFAPLLESRADFDAQPFRSYNVLPDALMVNFQTTRITIASNPQRSRPLITANPLPSNLQLRNEVRQTSGRCAGESGALRFTEAADDPNALIVSGDIPLSCGTFTIARAIMNAPNFAYGTFRTLWTQSGGAIVGASRLGIVTSNATLLYEHPSLPLAEVIRLVNKYSNNVMARHLLLTIAAERAGTPATTEGGRSAIRAWLSSHNIDMRGFVLDNGSGLSRAERVTARGIGEMLDIAWHSPFMPEFAASLPLSATDGTLRTRFSAAGMQGRIRLKTGHVDDVSALAGFVNAASGKTFVVVIFINHPGAHTGIGESVHAELIRWVFGQ
jgi:D-alanyl-D-alanine carboxypeptidase/D-alanyl-D-alanine-endopeptidase (penicillin-binding protein 4)